jgi:hypothetical protein
LNLSGAVAQYGRGVGIIQATSTQLMNQFAKSLKEKLAQGPAASPVAVPSSQAGAAAPASAPSAATPPPAARTGTAAPPAKPIAGFSLLAKVVWNWLTGLFRRQ